MRRQAFLPLVTYPDPISDAVAVTAVAMAKHLDADVHALALNVDIPPVSNTLSRLLLDMPEMIRQAEATSRKRGDSLLAAVAEQTKRAGIKLTTNSVAAGHRAGRRSDPLGHPAGTRYLLKSNGESAPTQTMSLGHRQRCRGVLAMSSAGSCLDLLPLGSPNVKHATARGRW